MPLGGGSAAAFNGGTITNELDVALTTTDATVATFQDAIGNGLFLQTHNPLEWDTSSADLLTMGGGGSFFFVGASRGVYFLNLTTEPADAVLAAGGCALWFDKTNGVGNTKLMAKGKSADGTVKSATVAVLT